MGVTKLIDFSQFTKMDNQNKSAEYWIKNLNLVEHPEHKDGFFAVPFEDTFKVLNRNKEERPVASIAYFLEKRTKSPSLNTKMFKCQSTEMVFYHAGLPVSIYIVTKDTVGPRSLKHVILGPEVDKGHVLSFASPAGAWFTRCVDTDSGEGGLDYSVVSVVLTPA